MDRDRHDERMQLLATTRRCFLRQCGSGLGAIALASVGARAGAMGARRPGHFPGRARRVISLRMAGSPPQHELWDHKPELVRRSGQPCPGEFLRDERCAFGKRRPRLLGTPYRFARRGEAGTWVSELLPHLGGMVDDLCVVRSMHTDQFNHAPAQLLLSTGFPGVGKPSLGSWVTYGLGSLAEDLPGYVVLVSGGKAAGAGKSAWSNGFLPAVHRGVECRTAGDPVLEPADPAGRDRDGAATRIARHEDTFRLQVSAPEVMDITREPSAVHARYGTSPGQPSFANNCLLARRLVERGVRFVELFDGGWDTHGSHPGDDLITQLPRKCRETDRPIAALLKDLRARGLLDETLVVWSGEFGRAPLHEARNGSRFLGRDHHRHCFTIWLAGGGVQGGLNWGATDELGYFATEQPVHVHDLQATILHLLGLDPAALGDRAQDRDVRLTDLGGQVVHGWIA